MTENEMVGWHHRLDGHEFKQALGIGDRQGSLAWSPSQGRWDPDALRPALRLGGHPEQTDNTSISEHLA